MKHEKSMKNQQNSSEFKGIQAAKELSVPLPGPPWSSKCHPSAARCRGEVERSGRPNSLAKLRPPRQKRIFCRMPMKISIRFKKHQKTYILHKLKYGLQIYEAGRNQMTPLFMAFNGFYSMSAFCAASLQRSLGDLRRRCKGGGRSSACIESH